jgi:hypothetical protein
MSLSLIRRLVKGTPLTAADHDGNLDKLETAVLARPTTTAANAAYATAAQGDLADSAVQPGDLATVATSGAYSDLSDRPTLGTAAATDADDYATAAQGQLADTALQPGEAAPNIAYGTITYAATVNLDLAARNNQANSITLTGALTLTADNLALGRTTGLLLIPGASNRTITFPVEWVFVSAKPATIPANKRARLTLECWGTTGADVIAAIAIQP